MAKAQKVNPIAWDTIDVIDAIMIAIDACHDRRYADAREILKDLPVVLVRTRDAGVHFGKLLAIVMSGDCYRIALGESRRIWNWQGANTLNEIALNGIASGKVSAPLRLNNIPQVIEVIPCEYAASEKLMKLGW